MTSEEFRSAVHAAIQAWGESYDPTLPIIYENGPVPDEDAIGEIWLDVEIRWYGAFNTTVGTIPRGRETGAISLNIFYKQGSGTQRPDRIADSLQSLFRNKRFGAAQTAFPQRTTPTNLRGWYKTGRLVPFYMD